jgi:ribonuclease R
VKLGKHISFTERRADDAEKELRQVKVLELLSRKIGEEFAGVITGITNFGVFVQLTAWLIDGLIRYEDLMDDWWQVDEKRGVIRGQRTGRSVRIVRVDPARRQLDLAITQFHGRAAQVDPNIKKPSKPLKKSQIRRGGQSMRKRRR